MLGRTLLAAVALIAPTGSRPLAQETAAPERTLARVAVVGASVSAGFHADATLADMLDASRESAGKPALDTATEMFFFQPGVHARQQIEKALAHRSTLIVGVDFLFWLGYGELEFDGTPLPSEEARMALLEQGLALLEKIETRVVLGDFPDMSHAVGRLLKASQQPKPETLAKLNQRLAEWAEGREKVLVVPLAAWVADLAARRPVRIGDATFEPEATARWMQPDRLHPTPEGLAALVAVLRHELALRRWIEPGELDADPARILARALPAGPIEAGATDGR